MLDCYFLDISPLLNGGILVNSLSVLPAARTRKVLSLDDPGERARSAGAGLLIEHVRSEYDVAGKLKVSRSGKPQFIGGPHFSVARSGSYAMIAVSDEAVGADIARISSLDPGEFPFMLTGDELSIVNAGGRRKRMEACRIWTCKESFVKALGGRIEMDPGSVTAARRNGDGFVLDLPGWSVHELNAPKGYCASICASPMAGALSVRNLFLSDDGASLF